MILALSGSRWPTYKVYGNSPPVAVEACATNLHTSVLDVINSGISSSVTSSNSSYEESISSNIGGLPPAKTHTSYCISTMAVPSVGGKPLTVSMREMLGGERERESEREKGYHYKLPQSHCMYSMYNNGIYSWKNLCILSLRN